MLVLLRHLFAILVLPVVMAGVVPRWLLTAYAHVDSRWSAGSPLAWAMRGLGAILLLAGFGLFCWCVALFAREGGGHSRLGIRRSAWSRSDHTAMCAIR